MTENQKQLETIRKAAQQKKNSQKHATIIRKNQDKKEIAGDVYNW